MSKRTEQFDLATYRDELKEALRTGVMMPFQHDVVLSFFEEKEMVDLFIRAVRASRSKDQKLADCADYYRDQKQELGDKDLALEATKARYGDQIDASQLEAECRKPSGRVRKLMKPQPTE